MNATLHIRRHLARRRAIRNAPARLALLLFALLALAVQSFVVQTHIHIPQAQGKAQSVSLIMLAASTLADKPHAAGDTCTSNIPRDKYPITDDPSNCPLCQEITQGGHYVQNPGILAVLPLSVNVRVIDFTVLPPSCFALSHSWRVRAPPSLSSTI